jgi:hypothetical protein
MSDTIVVDPAGPRPRGWRRLVSGDPSRPWAFDGWMEQGVWLPVRAPVCRRWCNRPATGEMALCEIHLREYLGSVHRKRRAASTLPTHAIMPMSGF